MGNPDSQRERNVPSTSWRDSRARVASRPCPPVSSLFLGQATAVACPDTPGTSVLETLLSSLTHLRSLAQICPPVQHPSAPFMWQQPKFLWRNLGATSLLPWVCMVWPERARACLKWGQHRGPTAQGGPSKHGRTRLLIRRAPAREQGRLSRSRPVLMTWALKETSSHAAFSESKPVSSGFLFLRQTEVCFCC